MKHAQDIQTQFDLLSLKGRAAPPKPTDRFSAAQHAFEP